MSNGDIQVGTKADDDRASREGVVALGSSLWGSRTEQKAFTAVPPRKEEECDA
jgi:hypothetical protein